MISLTAISEIKRSIAMSGQWQQPNKKTSKMAQSEIVFDVYPARRILVRWLHYCLPQKLTSWLRVSFQGGGAQLLAFTRGTNQQGPRKTCKDAMKDGDHWTIDFDYDNIPDE